MYSKDDELNDTQSRQSLNHANSTDRLPGSGAYSVYLPNQSNAFFASGLVMVDANQAGDELAASRARPCRTVGGARAARRSINISQ